MGSQKTEPERKPWDELSKEEQTQIRETRKQMFADSRREKLEAYSAIATALDTAYKNGVLAVTSMAAEGGEVFGDVSVVVGHSRKNSRLFNFVTGGSKDSSVRVPGWTEADFINGTINQVADGLSLGAARVFCNEYNAVIKEVDSNTKAITA
jgi:hypothetical protein